MKHFQAKDIQRLIGIPKHRYEYLASKIGIKPEIEEVEGTGHVHFYSFKNLLEFAFVHTANDLGLGPKAAKEMLVFLSTNIELQKAGLFNPDKTVDLVLHYIDSKDGKLFRLSGKDIPEEKKKNIYVGDGFNKLMERMSNDETMDIPDLFETFKSLTALGRLTLSLFDGYVTINLGFIKDRILKNIKG